MKRAPILPTTHQGDGRTYGAHRGEQALISPTLAVVAGGQKRALVVAFLVKLYGTCQDGQDVRDPMPTVTSGGNHIGEVRAFLVKYYGNEKDGFDQREPMHTITTKDRIGLVITRGEDYAIVDIGMRMLTPRELFRAQGFPENYVIERGADGETLTKTDQVRLCGNSVCPPVAAALVAANFAEPARRDAA